MVKLLTQDLLGNDLQPIIEHIRVDVSKVDLRSKPPILSSAYIRQVAMQTPTQFAAHGKMNAGIAVIGIALAVLASASLPGCWKSAL